MEGIGYVQDPELVAAVLAVLMLAWGLGIIPGQRMRS
jgi:hypothetical protein